MEISESEFISLFLIFLMATVILKNIEFLLRRSRISWLTCREARKIHNRLDILEEWMGMDKEEDEND